MANDDDIREAQRATWAGLSASWDKWDAVIMEQLRPVGVAMIESLDIASEQRHLDVASGTGEPGLSIAELAPSGHVLLTDLAPEMLDVAARRAQARGIDNVQTRVCSADDLPFMDASFDSVSVRFGYMFVPDLDRATAEFARVLRPGGRLCSSVWVRPHDNPWVGMALEAVATETVVPAPDPDAPGMFRCAAPGHISALYASAGLTDVAEWDVPIELVTGSAAQYWELISEHASPVATALRRVDAAARARIASAATSMAAGYATYGTIRIPGVARCIVGTKP